MPGREGPGPSESQANVANGTLTFRWNEQEDSTTSLLITFSFSCGCFGTNQFMDVSGFLHFLLTYFHGNLKGFVTDFNRFLNSQNLYLYRRKPKNNGPFLLTIAILEHRETVNKRL